MSLSGKGPHLTCYQDKANLFLSTSCRMQSRYLVLCTFSFQNVPPPPYHNIVPKHYHILSVLFTSVHLACKSKIFQLYGDHLACLRISLQYHISCHRIGYNIRSEEQGWKSEYGQRCIIIIFTYILPMSDVTRALSIDVYVVEAQHFMIVYYYYYVTLVLTHDLRIMPVSSWNSKTVLP